MHARETGLFLVSVFFIRPLLRNGQAKLVMTIFKHVHKTILLLLVFMVFMFIKYRMDVFTCAVKLLIRSVPIN